MSEMVLGLLKGSSAQQPIGFNHLVSETGFLPKTLTMILDGLYAKRTINEAVVTKNGVTERVVWLSGVVAPAVRQSIVITPKKIQLSGQLGLPSQPASAADKEQVDIPEFLRNQQNLQVEKTEAAESTEKPAPTTKVYKALKFIEANPNCTAVAIAKASGISTKNVCPCLILYINNGGVVIDKSAKQHTYSLTRSVDELMAAKGKTLKKSTAEPDHPVSESTVDVIRDRIKFVDVKPAGNIETGEQMMFGGITNEDDSTQTEQASALDQPANALLEWDTSGDQNQVESSAHKNTQETVNGDDRKVATTRHTPEDFFKAVAAVKKVNAGFDRALGIEAPQPATSGNFRVAYTNDGCLMLMGLNDYGLPVELNAAQTNDLIEFISEQIMPIGVSM